jgi:hypothetical protein
MLAIFARCELCEAEGKKQFRSSCSFVGYSVRSIAFPSESRTSYSIFSRPESFEFFYELKSLFGVFARCNVREFTVPKKMLHEWRSGGVKAVQWRMRLKNSLAEVKRPSTQIGGDRVDVLRQWHRDILTVCSVIV